MCFQQLEADENFYKENLKHQDEILEPSDCYGLWTMDNKTKGSSRISEKALQINDQQPR